MFEIWDNSASRGLEKKGKRTEALLFRIMNLTGRISLLFLILGIAQVGFALQGSILAFSDFSFFGVLNLLPEFTLICFVISSLVFSIFSFACAGVAYLHKQYLWAVGIVVLNILSVPYLWIRMKKK